MIFCTRFSELQPLLELDQTSSIRVEFRTNNQCTFMKIEDEVDLVSAFYTCNEIQDTSLLVYISMDPDLAQQLDYLNQKRLPKSFASPKEKSGRKRGRNIFGQGNKSGSPAATVPS